MSFANSSDIKNHVREYETMAPNKYMKLLNSKLAEQYPNAKLLTDDYLGVNEQYDILCNANKHAIKVKDYYIINCRFSCSPCAKAAANENKFMKLINDIADLHGGECMTEKYISQNTKMTFKCKNNHIWDGIPKNIVDKYSWCIKCPRMNKLEKASIADKIKALKYEKKEQTAKKRTYTRAELFYVESHKHIYNENSLELLEKKLDEVMPSAKLRENKFLGYCIGYPVVCKNNHKINIRDDSIMNGTATCRNCNQFNADDYKILCEIAEKKGGSLISTDYKGDRILLTWKCNIGHIWKATPNNVKRGSWCPKCLVFTNEERCRLVLNELLDAKLTKQRPDFLRYPKTDRPLELDGFDEKQQIAFEYNGIQHYEDMYYDAAADANDKRADSDDGAATEINFCSRLEYQQDKDKFKADRCRELGIKLFTIPYWEVKNKSDAHVVNYIVGMLGAHNILVSTDKIKSMKEINLSEFLPDLNKSNKYEKLALEIILPRKGKLIKINETDRIDNNRAKFKMQCRFGHTHVRTYEYLHSKHDRWCIDCSEDAISDIVRSKNKQLESANLKIREMDRFGVCLIECTKCFIQKKNVDCDEISQVLEHKCAGATVASTIQKVCDALDTICEKINYLKLAIDNFALLRDDGKIKYCKKNHWAAIESFVEEKSMCQYCVDVEAINYSKHKRCVHGKRIGKDRAPCSECAQ